MGSNFSSASEKRAEMSSDEMVCLTWWSPYDFGTEAGDSIHSSIKKSISCW